IAEALHDALGQYVKKTDIFQCEDHRQHGEQTGKGFEVKIVHILTVDRNYDTRYQSGAERYEHNKIIFYKHSKA
ncbi:MAG: hypothetical protein IJ299_01460, partial [Oscillospiraceae bacterium]|nr:hypothetical protein [Oscillospiraceae bacterium]